MNFCSKLSGFYVSAALCYIATPIKLQPLAFAAAGVK
jgi:hypothetical protein